MSRPASGCGVNIADILRLQHYRPNFNLAVITNASDITVGVMHKYSEQKRYRLSYRSLSMSIKKYLLPQ